MTRTKAPKRTPPKRRPRSAEQATATLEQRRGSWLARTVIEKERKV